MWVTPLTVSNNGWHPFVMGSLDEELTNLRENIYAL